MTNYSQSTFMWIVASSLPVCIDPVLSGLVIQHFSNEICPKRVVASPSDRFTNDDRPLSTMSILISQKTRSPVREQRR